MQCIFHVGRCSKANPNTIAENIDYFLFILFTHLERICPFLLKHAPSHISLMRTHGPQQMVQRGERGGERVRGFLHLPRQALLTGYLAIHWQNTNDWSPSATTPPQEKVGAWPSSFFFFSFQESPPPSSILQALVSVFQKSCDQHAFTSHCFVLFLFFFISVHCFYLAINISVDLHVNRDASLFLLVYYLYMYKPDNKLVLNGLSRWHTIEELIWPITSND